MSNPVPFVVPGIFSQSSRRRSCRAAVGRWSAACVSPMKLHTVSSLCIILLPTRRVPAKSGPCQFASCVAGVFGPVAKCPGPRHVELWVVRCLRDPKRCSVPCNARCTVDSLPACLPSRAQALFVPQALAPPSRAFCVAPRLSDSHPSPILASFRPLGLWRVHILTALRRSPHFSSPQTIIFLLTRCSCPPHNSLLPGHGTSHH